MDSRNGTWVLVLNLHGKHLTDGAMNLKDFFFLVWLFCCCCFVFAKVFLCVMGMIMTQKIALVSVDILPI